MDHPQHCKCVMCADPDFDMRKQIDENIARNKRQVIGVFPEGDLEGEEITNNAYIYTVGNAVKGFPELLLVGMYDDTGMLMVNWLSDEMMKRDTPYADGEIVSMGGKYPIMVVHAAEDVKDTMRVATQYLGRDSYDVLQVVLCDLHGRFPEDPECEAPFKFVRIRRPRKLS